MNPTIPPLAMGKIAGQTVTFNLDLATGQGRRKTLNSNSLKIYLLLYPARAKGLVNTYI